VVHQKTIPFTYNASRGIQNNWGVNVDLPIDDNNNLLKIFWGNLNGHFKNKKNTPRIFGKMLEAAK
jgi:hypothetical protein